MNNHLQTKHTQKNYLPSDDSRLTSGINSTYKGRSDANNIGLSRDDSSSKYSNGGENGLHYGDVLCIILCKEQEEQTGNCVHVFILFRIRAI